MLRIECTRCARRGHTLIATRLAKTLLIGALAALDLGKLAHQLPLAAVQILDRPALRGHAVAVHALLIGGNAVLCDEFAVHDPAPCD